MKVSCLQENLARGLSIVNRAVATRSTLPVLGNVLVATDGGRLRLSATNLEIAITCWVGASVREEGAVTVPARTFADLTSALPPDPVELELKETSQTLHVTCARTQANIKGLDAAEFPPLAQPDESNRIRLEADVLRHAISQVAFAAAQDEARPALTGVSTAFEGGRLTLAATDGFRLSVRAAHFPGRVDDPFKVLVPARALAEIGRIIDDDLETVYLSLPAGRNQVVFDMDNVILVAQLVDGLFPDYEPVIPRDRNTRAVMGTGELLKACRTADIFARDANNTARIRVEPGDGLSGAYATVAATSSETGDNEAQLDAEVEGDPVEISFNVKYMTDALNAIDTPQVALETTGPMEPGVLKAVGDDDFIHIIMPMQFSN